MNKQIKLSIQQRTNNLVELVEYAREQKFDKALIKKYEIQLKELQEEINRDKERKLNFNKVKKGVENGN